MGLVDKAFRFGPAYLSGSAANILQPGTLTGGILNGGSFPSTYYYNMRIVLTHIRIVNKSSSAQWFTLWLGPNSDGAAGTELMGYQTQIPANSAADFYFGSSGLPIDAGDYLAGQAQTSSTLTIEGEGDIGVA